MPWEYGMLPWSRRAAPRSKKASGRVQQTAEHRRKKNRRKR